jgi:DNA repair exonuclease SbcCD ATPase subunit
MDVQKLAKVMALAASDNEAEALHALRTARRLLDNAGLDFVAIADRLGQSQSPPALPQAAPDTGDASLDDLEDMIFDLRNELRTVRADNERLRQGKPATAPVHSPSPSLMGAAQDAAQLIRLRAELAEALGVLQAERARHHHEETAMRIRMAEATALSERLEAKLEQIKGRKDRLEVEVRRFGHVTQALKAELDERNAALESLRASRPAGTPAAAKTQPPAAPRRTKTPPAGQYALL